MDRIEGETRKQRIARESRERQIAMNLQLKQDRGNQQLRRGLVNGSLALVLAAGVVGISVGTYLLINNQASSISINIDNQNPEKFREILAQEAKKLNIDESQEEKELWKKSKKNFSNINTEDPQFLVKRLGIIVDAMRKSQNQFFRDAGEFINSRSNARELQIAFDSKDPMIMKSFVADSEGRVVLRLIIDPNILTSKDLELIATLISHEKYHLEKFENVNHQLINLPPAEVLKRHISKVTNPTEMLDEEAVANMIQVVSYLHNLALMGVSEEDGYISDRTFYLQAIRANLDPTDQGWRAYIKQSSFFPKNK